MPRICLPIIASLTLLVSVASAQGGFGRRPPVFDSVDVRDDRTITLRVHAPEAKAVRLSSSDLPGGNPFGPGVEMQRADNGVWETTVGPVPPGAYRYAFNVDGLTVI